MMCASSRGAGGQDKRLRIRLEAYTLSNHELYSWLRIRLEAYTLSNRGEMRQHLPTGYDIYLSPPWLEASTPNPLVLGTGFQPAVLYCYLYAEDCVRGYSRYRLPA